MTYAEILRNRNLQIPTKPLWKMEITAEEYEGMRETLRNACNANRLACYGKTLVYQWIKKWGETVDLPIKKEPVCIVELDEMHSYVMRKKLLLEMDCC